MRILGSGNGSWKREFLPGVETLRDTGTMHISCFLGLFFIFFSDARKYKETAQIGGYVFNIFCSIHFRLGDFLRVKWRGEIMMLCHIHGKFEHQTLREGEMAYQHAMCN
ncbi:hypothetical protein NW764_005076 [Fusarium oxysporum]|nr:hypothetical protein NW764_005076 [Fusarium oxysporum]